MRLDKVHISQFRNIEDVELEPSSSLNIIVGENGSGKTSLLEALHYLSYGRSFRTTKYQHLIRHNSEQFVLYAAVSHEDDSNQNKIGIQRKRNGQIEMKINGERQLRIADFAAQMPTQVFTPQSSDLLSGPPSGRRSFVDWGLFHVKQSEFSRVSRTYHKVLRHRNAALKARVADEDQHQYWQRELAKFGELLDQQRQAFISELKPLFIKRIGQFLPEFCFEFAYYRGWEKGVELDQALVKSAARDRQYGYSTTGPHKADLRLKLDGKLAQDVLSRGQLRLLSAALQLAQSTLLWEQRQESCLFLLDDLGAELDEKKRQLFLEELIDTGAQLFVTATGKEQIMMDGLPTGKVFHVEHGQVNEEKIING